MNLCILWGLFWITAVMHSVIYGIKCFSIHFASNPPENKSAKYAEYWFNGLGAFIGWIALYFALHLSWSDPMLFGWQHITLAYISFIGITGHLPYVAKFSFIKK